MRFGAWREHPQVSLTKLRNNAVSDYLRSEPGSGSEGTSSIRLNREAS